MTSARIAQQDPSIGEIADFLATLVQVAPRRHSREVVRNQLGNKKELAHLLELVLGAHPAGVDLEAIGAEFEWRHTLARALRKKEDLFLAQCPDNLSLAELTQPIHVDGRTLNFELEGDLTNFRLFPVRKGTWLGFWEHYPLIGKDFFYKLRERYGGAFTIQEPSVEQLLVLVRAYWSETGGFRDHELFVSCKNYHPVRLEAEVRIKEDQVIVDFGYLPGSRPRGGWMTVVEF